MAVALAASACAHDDAALDGGVDGSVDDDGGAPRDFASVAPSKLFAYVTAGGAAPLIMRYSFDAATGSLTLLGEINFSATFLAVDPARRHLFAANEAASTIESYEIDPKTGDLTDLNGGASAPSGGSGPAHLTVDGTGQWVLVANYGSGDVGILYAGPGGEAGGAKSVHPGANAHEVVLDGAGHAWVPCLGSDYIAQYNFDNVTGALTPMTPPTVATPAGSGPRHLALNPTLAIAYLIEEKDSMIGVYDVAASTGALTLKQRLSSRAAGATVANTGAEVQVHPSGKWVYVSNRGDDDLGVFAVGSDGKLTEIAHTKTGGQTPRHFSLERSGRWLLVANQGSGDVRVFAIDNAAGTLTATGTPVLANSPSFVGLVPLP